MKFYTLIALLAGVLWTSPSASWAETLEVSAQGIVTRFEEEKVAALETYLSEKPEATDREVAVDALIHAYQELARFDRVAELISARLEELPTGDQTDPPEYIGTVQALVEAQAMAGRKVAALDVIETAKAAVEGHAMASQMQAFLGQVADSLKRPQVGDTLEIAFKDLNGEPVDLAAMKGQVVLVDFWATWCGPCVAELPNVQKAHETFHGEGFEVIGISLDEDRAALEAFIKERGMDWPQSFSGKGFEDPIVSQYGIEGIPATFLIGKDGKIFAKDLRGTALADAVERALAVEG